jgi:mono/diheme cytochrome c family protein
MRGFKKLLLAGAVVAVLFPASLAAQRSGAQAWAESCGNCHINQPPNRYKAERWAIIMRHMQIYARLTDAETEAILEFLQAGARQPESAEAKQDEGVQLASGDPAYLPVSSSTGEQIYKNQCVACHGKKGKGDGPAAVALNPRPSNLTDAGRMQELTDDELRKVIAEGTGSMPGFESILKPDELEAVLEYIRQFTAAED